MKKNFTRILLTCLICTVILCMAANAETQTLLPNEEGKYSATYAGTAGEYYAILIVEGTYEESDTPTITEESIIYISQETAGSNGNATFADFIPSTATNGTVYIGGSDLESAVLFGYLSTGVEETATISVAAGSTVYFVDGASATYSDETEVEVPAEAGILYVNTGYTTHTVYVVDDAGTPTKVEALDNAVLGADGAGIRTTGVQGIRFRSSVDNDAKAFGLASSTYEIKEYGFIVTAETTTTGLKDTEYTLDMSLVNHGVAKKGVAYNKEDGTNIEYANADGRTTFTSVVKNIPMTKDALQTQIVSRPYYIITDGETDTVLYGELTSRSVYDVATLIKSENGADYTANKTCIDSVISTVEGS